MQVTENIDLPSGVEPTLTTVELQLVGSGGAPLSEAYDQGAQRTVVGLHRVRLDSTGAWSLNLNPNSALIPAGTVWRRSAYDRDRVVQTSSLGLVPATGGPYRWDQILANPPGALADSALAAHAADLTLHGGGTQLFLAEVASNFVTASTTFVDIPGATRTFTIPNRPFVVEFQIAAFIEEAAQHAEVQLLAGATQLDTARDAGRIAGDLRKLGLRYPVPSLVHQPVAFTQVTYKLRVQTSVATSDVTVLADLFGLKWGNWIRGEAA